MKKTILIIVAILVGLSFTFIFAEDFKTPHKFKSGDVISADVLNEIFDYIDSSKNTITPSSLVGTWQCTKYKIYNNPSGLIPPGYQFSNGNLFVSMSGVILNIFQASDGSIRWNSPSRNALAGIFIISNSTNNLANGRYDDECAGTGIIDAIQGDFGVSSNNCLSDLSGWGPPTWSYKLDVNRISDTRIRLSIPATAYLLCDFQNTPPAEPLNLIVTNDNKNISLTWTDNSSDETGFKVIRRDSLEGNWNEIGSTAANLTTFLDTVTSTGTYWYRVKSFNNNGTSLGSNVVKITVE